MQISNVISIMTSSEMVVTLILIIKFFFIARGKTEILTFLNGINIWSLRYS